jgi:hypothetical protein
LDWRNIRIHEVSEHQVFVALFVELLPTGSIYDSLGSDLFSERICQRRIYLYFPAWLVFLFSQFRERLGQSAIVSIWKATLASAKFIMSG